MTEKIYLYPQKSTTGMLIPKQAEELVFLIASIFIFVASFLAQITNMGCKKNHQI